MLGPALGPDTSHSLQIVKRMLDGQAATVKINSGVVDVRDVADLHLRAMSSPMAAGERFIATAGDSLWMTEIAAVLRRRLGVAARKAPTRALPNGVVRLLARCNPAMRGLVPLLGLNLNASGEKARRVLGWAPRSSEEAIVATAESLLRLGMAGRPT